MSNREELRQTGKLSEWLISKFHWVSSNHSQNWILPIFWITFFGLFSSYFQPMDNYVFTEYDFIYKELLLSCSITIFTLFSLFELVNYKGYSLYFIPLFLMFLFYINYTNDIYFSIFSNLINPFSIMTKGESLTLGILCFKVIIGYLIYQLIVSIRQNTRRK